MRVYFKVCAVLAIAFSLGSCYESKVPMGVSRDSTIDENLIGKWKGKVKRAVTQDEVDAEMLILKFNDDEYYVGYKMGKEGYLDHFNIRAYTVIVDGVPFLNAQNIDDIEEDERTFTFFTYSISQDGVLTLKMVSDDFVRTDFKSSAELYEFIKTNLNNEELYERPIIFRKIP